MAQSLEDIKASFEAPTHRVVNGVREDLTAEEVEATLNTIAEIVTGKLALISSNDCAIYFLTP